LPYEWTPQDRAAREVRARVWPHKSMTPEGFGWFIGLTAALLAFPLIGLLGTVVLWGVLPFLLGALWAVWTGLRRNQRDLSLWEEVELTEDRIAITRHNPRGPRQDWEANPYWVELKLHPKGKVENYLTLRGSDREVELGAFLSPEERLTLHDDLLERLAQVKRR
jgi:uncharacterized membrane protein